MEFASVFITATRGSQLMVLQFKTVTVTIPQTTGVFNANQDTSFPGRVRNADVALKAFKLDYVGGARDSDISQASVSLESFADEAVEFKVKANYSAATYTGEISVLVIADIDRDSLP
jgi:hypothetical protein